MLVPVCVDAAAKEWSLLEFQGDVIAGAGSNPADMRGLDIGTLRFGEGGEITLRIGNHILAGKVAKLAKPFAILQQHKQREGASVEPDVDVDMEQASAQSDSGDASGASDQVRYEVVGVARTRVIFGSRPKPVLG
ncbi:hypothetical protein BBJ28_00007798 [Nothophytophthora sp. Chile5]|nr:hypothetical protein BBJ28_00007798 [Nothophytophthora sp. Chile5]